MNYGAPAICDSVHELTFFSFCVRGLNANVWPKEDFFAKHLLGSMAFLPISSSGKSFLLEV